MKHKLLNTKGFATVELLVALVVVVVIALVGGIVYHQGHKAKTAAVNSASTKSKTSQTATAKTAPPADPYAGWSSYTTRYEKLSFKYPSGWKVTDQSSADDTDVTPGQDSVSVISSDGLEVSIGGGVNMFTGSGPAKSLSSTAITMLGGVNYLTFLSNNDAETTTGEAVITTTALSTYPTTADFPKAKNVTLSSSAVLGIAAPFNLIALDYNDNKGVSHEYSLATFQQDQNYNTALEILKSIGY